MKKRVSPTLIGAFVIGALVLVAGGIVAVVERAGRAAEADRIGERLVGGEHHPRALVALQWQVDEDEGFSRLRRSGTVWADPAQAHSVRVHADGLTRGRIWFCRFIAGNEGELGEAVNLAGLFPVEIGSRIKILNLTGKPCFKLRGIELLYKVTPISTISQTLPVFSNGFT